MTEPPPSENRWARSNRLFRGSLPIHAGWMRSSCVGVHDLPPATWCYHNASIHHYETLDKVLGQKHKEQYKPMFRSLGRAYKSGLESSSSPKLCEKDPWNMIKEFEGGKRPGPLDRHHGNVLCRQITSRIRIGRPTRLGLHRGG